MRMHLGVSDTFVGQPGVQLIVGFDPKARCEETLSDETDLILDLTVRATYAAFGRGSPDPSPMPGCRPADRSTR
jgi:hypothetical protein